MELIFEKSREGVRGATIRPLEVKPHVIAEKYTRKDLDLPEVAEVDMARHYTELSKRAFGVDSGFYPLGSCTMNTIPSFTKKLRLCRDLRILIRMRRRNPLRGTSKLWAFCATDL